MSARRARRYPPRWFRRAERYVPNYLEGDGYRYRLVIEEPRFPVMDVARSCGVLTVGIPVGVVIAVVITCVAWVAVFTAVGT